MSNFPNHCSCCSGTWSRRGIKCLLAGLRSLLVDHRDVPSSLRLWVFVGRVLAAALCFAGGFLVAKDLAETISAVLHAASMGWAFILMVVTLLSLLATLTPLFVSWICARSRAWGQFQCRGAGE